MISEIKQRTKRKSKGPRTKQRDLIGSLTLLTSQKNTRIAPYTATEKFKGEGKKLFFFFCDTGSQKPGLQPGECFRKYHILKNLKPEKPGFW